MDDQLQRLRRTVAGQGATDDETVLRLAAAITRARGLGAETARAISRDLFWADVRRLGASLRSHEARVVLRRFGDGIVTWGEVPQGLRMDFAGTGRLDGPEGWREILAHAPIGLTSPRQDLEPEHHLATRMLVMLATAESRRLQLDPTYPEHGLRVRWPAAADHHPNFVVPAGMTGTVVWADPEGDPCVCVRADLRLDDADEWSNEVQWNAEAFAMGLFWDEVEAIS